MFENFGKKPFKDKLKDTSFLIKNSFTIVGKSSEIKKPAIRMIIFSSILTTVIFLSLLGILSGQFFIMGILLLLLYIFILLPFSFFYYVRQKADLSWMIFKALSGREIDYNKAQAHTKTQRGTLRKIAFIDLLVSYAYSQRKRRNNIMGVIIHIFLALLESVWDLLKNFLIPATVIEQKPIKELVPKLKSLKNNVPAALVGVFGIDFVGDMIKFLLVPVYFLFLLLSLFVGYFIALFSNFFVVTILNFSFSWMPVIIMMYVILLIGGVISRLVDAVKIVYFTIFYTSLTRPMEITPDIRDEVTNYLLIKKEDFEVKKPTPQDQYVEKLANYVEQCKLSGYTDEKITELLLSKGHSKENIQKAIKRAKEKQEK